MKVSKSETSRSPSSPVVFSSSIEDLLREKFIKKMISNSTKIFSCWPNFEKSLPRRKYNVKGTEFYIPLYTLEYYARDDDLQRFANEIMEPPEESEQIRTWVKYIAAPSCSGKTTCILPAFLKTTLTHYFYIAFDNNQNNNYRLWSESSLISKIPDIARLQGADFMLQCIKRFLDSLLPGPHQIECNPNPPDFQTTKDELGKYLNEKLGDQHQCLFHLDEHRKMCPRISEEDTGKDFSRGAMELLARVPRAQVVATYTDVPSLPSKGSSGVCRIPLKMPILNINKVMDTVPELRITIPSKASRSFHRKLATLKLRLSMNT
jgi:DNA-binding transcriptional MerR regulator